MVDNKNILRQNPWALPEFAVNRNSDPLEINRQKEKQGFEEGYQNGIKEAGKTIQQSINQLSQAIADVNQQNQEKLIKIKQQCIDFTLAACEKILRIKLEQEPKLIVDIFNQAIDSIHIQFEQQHVRVYCHDDLYALLKENNEQHQYHFQIEVDPTLAQYNFKVESHSQNLKFDLTEALHNLSNIFQQERTKYDLPG